MQIAELTADLKRSAFGEYGDLLDNELVQVASNAYIADLVNALLLPRRENEFVPTSCTSSTRPLHIGSGFVQ